MIIESILVAPCQELIEIAFSHVFDNEFEKRKIIGITENQVYYTSNDFFSLDNIRISKGKVAMVLTINSKGEYEKFKMFHSNIKGYCYSQIKCELNTIN